MKKTIVIGASIIIVSLFFTSCRKDPGKGGKASLKGSVIATFYCGENKSVKSLSGAPGEKVYISYGGGNYYDDDMRSGSNGEFEFKYLNPGKYRISVLSECDTCISGRKEIAKVIEIGKKDKDVSIGEVKIDLFSDKYCDGPGKGGTAIASGVLGAVFINGNNGDTLSVGNLLDKRVYLVYGESSTASDDVRSSGNGTYQFTELRPGKYRVFAYSDCILCPNEISPVYANFEISSKATEVEIPKLQVVIIK